MDDKIKILAGVIVLAIVLFLVMKFYEEQEVFPEEIIYSDEITKQEKYCEASEDCQLIELKCCHHPFGGNITAVNNDTVPKIDKWKEENCLECQLSWWIAHFDFLHREAYCEKQECKVKVTPECGTIQSECSIRGKEYTINEFTQSELDQLEMTAEEVVEYCGC